MVLSAIDPARRDRRSGLKKLVATAVIAAAYALINHFLRIHLPGVSNVDLRPQILLLFVAGYLYGPGYGFAAGFAGNLGTDLLFGYGFRYLPSWTIGNGLIGALICLYPYRKSDRLDRIGQLVGLVISLILVNALALAYAAGMESLLVSHLPPATNFRYFYVPALLSNILGTLILFPLILLGLGRLKMNFPIKLALANYYLTAVLLVFCWAAFIPTYQGLFTAGGMDMARGNALVDAFNHWSLLLVILLIFSFVVSGWMSKTIVTPLKRLEGAVVAVLKGDPGSADRLASLAKREDEVGILGYTVRLLSEKLWETQKLFRDELEKGMKFLDSHDSGTDIFVIALLSLFGRDALGESEDDAPPEIAGEMNNLAAISLIVSASGLKELAATYSEEKIAKSFEGLDLDIIAASLSQEERQALAVAVDVNLLFKGRLKVMDLRAPLDRDLALHLLERGRAFLRSGRNFVGYLTEPDIIGKMLEKWEQAPKVRNPRLETVLNRAIGEQAIAGYQIKNRAELALFDPERKIAYSHSSFKHIRQLLGLLIGENLQAKLQLEPKRSSFRFRAGWEKTVDLHLEPLAGGEMAAQADEFDLVMEFTSREHRDRFRRVIEAYAKRTFAADHQVLFGSWYQPLYRSEVPLEGYHRIADITLQDRAQVVHAYVPEEQAAATLDWFKRELQDLSASTGPIWVNDAFRRYLDGNSE